MSYQVLALKYRPQNFNDVVGQSHVTTTLSNAIEADRVAHAILFTGPRGTGKTTIARIMAKAMNCKEGPTPSPCNQCKTCTDIINGHCSDVFEIDGASNNSVDQIRDLRENVTYMPASAPYKIYIIDEVHMLSTAAFNALLKTLEEPPEHVMFIFATTEVHKIPATILSRCQRHDLGRIPLEDISAHLLKLCAQEGVTMASDGADLISMEADGSIRDSLSLLDRILSAVPDSNITYDHVVDCIGVVDRKLVLEISNAVLQKDGARIIELIDDINNKGTDLKKFFDTILTHFRNMNVLKLCGPEASAVNLSSEEKKHIHSVVAPFPPGYTGTLLQTLLNNAILINTSPHTRTAFEMTLLKLIQIQPGADLDSIIEKLDALSRGVKQNFTPKLGGREPFPTPPAQEMEAKPAKAQQANSLMPPPIEHQAPAKKETPIAPMEEQPPQQGNWAHFLDRLKQLFPSISGPFFKIKSPIDDNTTKISVNFPQCSSFEQKRLKGKETELNRLCKEVMGKALDISFSNISLPKAPSEEKQKPKFQTKQVAFSHPLVMETKQIFNGEIL